MRLAVLGPSFNAWHDFLSPLVLLPLRHVWYYIRLWDITPPDFNTFKYKSHRSGCGCLDCTPLQQDWCCDCYNMWWEFLLGGQSASGPTRYARTSGRMWRLTESDWLCLAACSTVPLYCSQSTILSLSSSSSSLPHVSRAHCVAGLVSHCPNPPCLDQLIRQRWWGMWPVLLTGRIWHHLHEINGIIQESGMVGVCFLHNKSVSVVQLQRKAELRPHWCDSSMVMAPLNGKLFEII